ncbi:MAG: hypothetical protein LUD15_14470, partial [Bacteroides sp.]|nr:hypothetical protein [Bacteroides sp.]
IMENKDIVYELLIQEIKKKIPERGKRTARLMEILCLEKEAIYRRIRKDVSFSFAEMAEIARELNISLDNIKGSKPLKSRPYQMNMYEFFNLSEKDYETLEETIRKLKELSEDPTSEVGGTFSALPLTLICNYEKISRFFCFKWMYQYANSDLLKNYREVIIPERFIEVIQRLSYYYRSAYVTYYIWDKLTFYHIVKDITYFANVQLITPGEVKMLKKELLVFLDDLEKLAISGEFVKGKKVYMYVSSINFETSYIYMNSSSHKSSRFKAFTVTDISSSDEETAQRMRMWMQSMKRTSTMISESGEMQRVRFFNLQREYVNRL